MVEEIRRKRLISEQKGENKEDARKNAKEDQFLKET
jgi:DNA-binding TFAR19-related protein (PDSD5 family)